MSGDLFDDAENRQERPKRPSSSGKCNRCGRSLGKAAMARHLGGCLDAKQTGNSSVNESFHVLVEGGYRKIYWLHLAVPQAAVLSKLDKFLRDTWLECCGHLSRFNIDGCGYASAPMDDMFDSSHRERSMRVPAGKALRVGTKFSHEYDYGSTTELSLRVLGVIATEGKAGEIQLLARNDAPPIDCEKCGSAATLVCSQCLWEGSGWVCDQCAEDHRCGEEMLLPVVNSPRVGVCGYTG